MEAAIVRADHLPEDRVVVTVALIEEPRALRVGRALRELLFSVRRNTCGQWKWGESQRLCLGTLLATTFHGIRYDLKSSSRMYGA